MTTGEVLEFDRLETRYGPRVKLVVQVDSKELEIWAPADVPDFSRGQAVPLKFDSQKNKWRLDLGERQPANGGHNPSGRIQQRLQDVSVALEGLRALAGDKADTLGLEILLQLAVLLVKD